MYPIPVNGNNVQLSCAKWIYMRDVRQTETTESENMRYIQISNIERWLNEIIASVYDIVLFC